MRLLILGGTRFLGRHLVTAALARHHDITLFNRRKHSPTSLTGVETIYGDRNDDLAKLQGRRWDAVVDTCGYLPRTVRASAEILSESVHVYVFVSSQSVYADKSDCGADETAPLKTLTSEQLDQANAIDSSGDVSAATYGGMYGGLKALCEQTAEEILTNRVLIIRPGLIVGPYDYTDRFTYWVVRVACGGEVLVPGRPDRYIQFIDVRDLAEWIVRMIEREERGVYNANGLPNNLTMERVLEECKRVSDSDASFTWVSENFLMQEKVAPWSEMPLWLPEVSAEEGAPVSTDCGSGRVPEEAAPVSTACGSGRVPEEAAPVSTACGSGRVLSPRNKKGFMFINCDRAIGAGLSFRPLNDTIKDTLTWHEINRPNEKLKAGIDRDREQRLLRKWHETQ